MPKGVYERKKQPVPPIRRVRPWQERFEEKVARSFDPGRCDLWTAATDRRGYGKLQIGTMKHPKFAIAPRLAWELANGPIPDGKYVLHRCDNPLCVKPAHLFVGTSADNAADKVAKGRQLRGAGHPSAKLTADQVREIRALNRSLINMSAVARAYGVSVPAIWNLLHNKTYKEIP